MSIYKAACVLRLDQSDIEVAEDLKALHDSAYAVEARVLGLEDFRPLQRPVDSYVKSKSVFYGYISKGRCLGSVELDAERSRTIEVSSLVVDPDSARRGIATVLMQHVLAEAGSRPVIVCTAAANYPAVRLYEGLGFRTVDQWTNDDGIDIVQLSSS